MTLAFLVSREEILAIDPVSLNLILSTSPRITMLNNFMSSGCFNDETIEAGVAIASKQSEIYFRVKEYRAGSSLFLCALIIWRGEKSSFHTL